MMLLRVSWKSHFSKVLHTIPSTFQAMLIATLCPRELDGTVTMDLDQEPIPLGGRL